MKLILKFAVLMLIPLAGLLFTFFEAQQALHGLAKYHVEKQAKLLIEAASAARSYTKNHVKPLLRKPEHREFIRESVPAFAARQTLKTLKENDDYADYYYKEAAVHPTIKEDQASDEETQWINMFKQGTKEREFVSSERPDAYVFARPMLATADCIVCHDTKEKAKLDTFIEKYGDMIAAYGEDKIDGFNWQANDVIAAQVVYVPKKAAEDIARKAMNSILIAIVTAGLLTIVSLWGALVVLVIRPVARLSQMAEEISRGRLSSTQLPVRGNDEMAHLTVAFNRMNLSLNKALKRQKST